MSILNTSELVKQARSEGRAESKAELTRLRRELRRLRGWLRAWDVRAVSNRGRFLLLESTTLRGALRGKPAPRRGR